MAKNSKSEINVGGPYLIQDSDHMVDPNQTVDYSNTAKRGNARQADQSQAGGRQQGSDHGSHKPRRQAQ